MAEITVTCGDCGRSARFPEEAYREKAEAAGFVFFETIHPPVECGECRHTSLRLGKGCPTHQRVLPRPLAEAYFKDEENTRD